MKKRRITDAEANKLRNLHLDRMKKAWTIKSIETEYEAACFYHQFGHISSCGGKDCRNCWITKMKNDEIRKIRQHPDGNVTVNLFGCNVTINIKEGGDE